LCEAHDDLGEMRIVRTATFIDGRLFLDEGLIFPVQIKSRLDRDRTVRVKAPFVAQ